MLLLPALVLASIHLPAAFVGAEYDSGPIAPGAVMGCKRGMPYFRLADGNNLPDGLNLRSSGRLAGTPRHAGEYRVTLEIDNGCGRATVSVQIAVRGRAILAAFETEVELTEAQQETQVRIYADRPGLAYTAEASVPWLHVKPLRGRTPEPGEALAADILTISLDRAQLAASLAAATNPDGPAPSGGSAIKEAIVRLSCFRCQGTTIHVKW